MKSFTIDKQHSEIKVTKYLRKILPNASTSFLYKHFRKKNITLNDKKIEGNEILVDGDKISIFFKDETFDKFSKVQNSFTLSKVDSELLEKLNKNIIYEDDNIIIIDKWKNIKSQQDNITSISLNELCIIYLKEKNEATDTMSIVNRLDTNTTGLIIFAKNYKAARVLTDAIKNKKIKKYYKSIVNGKLNKKSDIINCSFIKDENLKKTIITDFSSADTEVLSYEVLEEKNINGDTYSILSIKLLSGKYHIIRAVFSYMGNPLVLDKKYMSDDLYHKNKKDFTGDGQKLLCYKLEFDNLYGDLSYLNKKVFYSNRDLV